MGSLRVWPSLLLALVGVTACSSWSGPQQSGGGNPIADHGNVDEGDSGVPGIDGGKPPDAGTGDGGADASVGRTSTLGDDRADFEDCGEVSCDAANHCCTSSGPQGRSWCNPEAMACGTTEGFIACDGPEDCTGGKVCCHETVEHGAHVVVRSQCLDGALPASDAGPASRACATVPDGPELRVACHTDADCSTEAATPFCREGAAGDVLTLGYCVSEADDPSTPGHDDIDFVGCGDFVEGADGGVGAGASCQLTSEQRCCVSHDDGSVAGCGAISACGKSEIDARCDGPEDCGGKVCCAVPEQAGDGGASAPVIECVDSCSAPGAITRCHAAKDCGEGLACEPDPVSPWWGSCVPG